ncbi:MAG: hypothetical protein K8I30_20360 [Anaerolineae bacterium]|nr:hypothetical protein [Anaerolineae bacterium]
MLATLAQVRREIKVDPFDKVDFALDNYLIQALQHVTARIHNIKEYKFEPHREALRFDALGWHISPDALTLDLGNKLLLEVTSIVDGEGTTLTPYNRSDKSGEYYLRGGETPYTEIQIAESSNKVWTNYDGEYIEAIEITGIWGYRRQYSEAWVSANDTVQDNPLSSSATQITIADADGQDVFGLIPRFSPGMFLRIESEYVLVMAVDPVNNKLTVRRGVNGTTAAAHAQNTSISLWLPEPTINRAALKWAGYHYKRQGSYEQVVVEGESRTIFPDDAPVEVTDILDELTDYGLWTPV